jgi:PAS domain S-box-containing protein
MTEIILESISDGVFTVDDQWRLTSFNKAAERITGIDRSEAIGKLCHEVFKSNMCESECPLRRTMRTGKRIVDRAGYCLTPSGERVPISVSTALLVGADGKAAGGAETFRDLREIEDLKEKLNAKEQDAEVSSRNPEMRRLLDLVPAIAESPATVLIRGETGTGKEVLARAIHRRSLAAKGPFVAVNCGALPEALLESELFGYRKGAFTGADRDKPGRFKLAENGTLFLDEIGDLSPALQVKLLRVLQEREYDPLGATAPERTNARVVCATNRNLKELVLAGRFRQDLYYRINVIELELPALRDRAEDLPHLAEHFLDVYARRARKAVRGIAPEVFSAFYAYRWPGNIRELENVVERAVVLCAGKQIDGSLLPAELVSAPRVGLVEPDGGTAGPQGAEPARPGGEIRARRRDAEKAAILVALRRNGMRCSAAAYELGIDKATLYRKLKVCGIALRDIRKQ